MTDVVTVRQLARALGVEATATVDGADGAAVTLKQFKVAAAKNGRR